MRCWERSECLAVQAVYVKDGSSMVEWCMLLGVGGDGATITGTGGREGRQRSQREEEREEEGKKGVSGSTSRVCGRWKRHGGVVYAPRCRREWSTDHGYIIVLYSLTTSFCQDYFYKFDT